MNSASGGDILFHFKGDSSGLDKEVSKTSSLFKSMGKVGAGVLSVVGTASSVAGASLIAMGKNSVKAYAEVEQSIGGVETLFKESADTVIANSKRAYETAGMDANTYMQQITSFSASLLQSLGGDTQKAAEVGNMAIIDMSDNANKMGTSMEAIQNAYQGFAKQNYTMLDNLKLGYGGTKTEMERLLADAEKITGIKYDISNLNDVYQAIHVIQGELGITGTTSKEASDTIQGSMASARAAFQNFISGQGGIEPVVTSFVTAGKNIAQAFITMLPSLVQGIIGLVNGLLPMIPQIVQAVLPALSTGVVELVNGLVNILPDLIDAILQGTILIITALAEGLPTMIPAIVDAILQIIPLLISYMPLFIEAGIKIILGLIQGILKSMPNVLSSVGKIGKSILSALGEIPLKVINIGLDVVKGIGKGITSGLSWIKNKIKEFVGNVTSFIKKVFKIGSPSKLMSDQVGQWIPKGIAVGIDANTDSVYDSMKEMQDSISGNFGLSPQLANSLHYSPSVNVVNNVDVSTDPLGQTVNKIKTFSGGAKNDYNYGMGV